MRKEKMTRDEERKMDGIALAIAKPEKLKSKKLEQVVHLDFEDGSALSAIDPEKTQEDLRSSLGNEYVSKMIKAGMDITGSSYVINREFPKRLEVWPSSEAPCVEVRPYYFDSEEPENWSIALDLIKL